MRTDTILLAALKFQFDFLISFPGAKRAQILVQSRIRRGKRDKERRRDRREKEKRERRRENRSSSVTTDADTMTSGNDLSTDSTCLVCCRFVVQQSHNNPTTFLPSFRTHGHRRPVAPMSLRGRDLSHVGRTEWRTQSHRRSVEPTPCEGDQVVSSSHLEGGFR